MSKRALPIGQAQSTAYADTSARRLSNAIRKERGLPPKPTAAEMENDNVEHYMTQFCGWAPANQGIPTYFNEDLSPSSNSKKCCTASTLIGYIGKHLKEICELLPAHPDWKDLPKDQHPQWWTHLRSEFLTAAYRYQMNQTGDETFGESDILPLYKDLKGVREHDVFSQCDFKAIIANLAKAATQSNHNLQHIAWLVLTWDAIGRGEK
jgi:hypothetical protein